MKRGGVPALGRGAASMALYTVNAFAPQGGGGHRTSLRGGGPVSTLLAYPHASQGDTLWARVWANVETAEQIVARAPGRNPQGAIFPWLRTTRTSEKNGGRLTTPEDVHPLQVYWGMPRRIRLEFEPARGRRCGVTGDADAIVVASYRTQRYGTDYSGGFRHPLTPYYSRKADDPTRLPVHAQPGGIGYWRWSGFVVSSTDGLREPAQAIAHWHRVRARYNRFPEEVRLHAFGYDVVGMKARAWVEREMPLWRSRDGEHSPATAEFVQHAVAGAEAVGGLLVLAVRRTRRERPEDARGDYEFVAERLYRETECGFRAVLRQAQRLVEQKADAEDGTLAARQRWLRMLRERALVLFDEYAPSEGLEDRNMERHVRARVGLLLVLLGKGAKGRELFEQHFGIPAPEKPSGRTAA